MAQEKIGFRPLYVILKPFAFVLLALVLTSFRPLYVILKRYWRMWQGRKRFRFRPLYVILKQGLILGD